MPKKLTPEEKKAIRRQRREARQFAEMNAAKKWKAEPATPGVLRLYEQKLGQMRLPGIFRTASKSRSVAHRSRGLAARDDTNSRAGEALNPNGDGYRRTLTPDP